MNKHPKMGASLTLLVTFLLVILQLGGVARAQTAPSYYFDPTWPKQPFPNNWKIGGVMGIDFEPDDTIWIYNRPNDLTSLELRAEPNPPIADCCVRPPAVIHFDKNGNVLGYFDAPQGHGMAVDDDGFVYLGQDTVRKYDPSTGEVVGEIARTPEREGGGRVGLPPPMQREAGQGGFGPVINFLPNTPTRTPPTAEERAESERAAMEFRQTYPPETPMIVGGLEEIRIIDEENEIYVADNYLGGRILVFDLQTLEFKRGWGAYGKPLSEISIDDADHEYTPNGPMPADFAGHLTVNVSNDGLVYAADRNANRIHVTTTEGEFVEEFVMAPETGAGGSTGGVAFSADPEQEFLYISDLTNNHIWFLNRSTGEVVGRMGTMSDQAGQFFGLHMIAVDSQGNIYTGEVFTGQRLQRFVPADSPRGRLLEQLAAKED